MSLTPVTAQQDDALKQDILLLQEIGSLLSKEQGHLERGEPWALPELTRQKQAMAEELDRRYAAREPALRAAGLPLTMQGMQRWLKSHAKDAQKFDRQWQQFLELARNIKSLNHINGRLIGMHLQHLDSRLQSLTQAAGLGGVYGAGGQTERPSFSRSHTTA